MTSFSPQITLLLECAKQHPNTQELNEKSLHVKDWNQLIQLANAHGILPLVHKALKECDTVPAPIKQQLKLHYMNIVKQNMQLTAELINVTKLLNDNSIETLAFKGPSLADKAYGDITLRQYCDLDILVHPEDLKKISKLLHVNGYHSKIEEKMLTNEKFVKLHSDVSFFHNTKSVHLELHWQLFHSSNYDKLPTTAFWENCHTTRINDVPIKTFDLERLLIYLCIHGSKHTWERIEWIVDIDRAVRSLHVNIESALKRAEEAKCSMYLKLGLYLAHLFFETPLPEHILITLKSKQMEKLTKKVIQGFKNILKEETENEKNYRHFHFELALKENLLQKISFISTSTLTVQHGDINIDLPKQLHFLYYFIRPFRLMKKYALKLINKN